MAKIKIIRHSLAHILAAAIQKLYPNTKFGMGPDIENGFYYDFELQESISPEDFKKIEKKMRELIKNNIEFKKEVISKEKAKKIFKNQPYKLELLKDMEGEISIYKSEDFIDLCKGPHVKNSKELPEKGFKIERVAGAYWKGDEKNKMLTRVYALAFNDKKTLNNFLEKKEKAKKRDHRKLGQELGLFMNDEEVGAGLPLWKPKGALLRKNIENYLYKELSKQDYQWIVTPHIGKLSLWEKSGHWNMYRENMYSPIDIDDQKYLIKPMNCPFHVKIYNSEIRSYKDLPIKYAELGTVYRYERSGTLHGLTRVRGFTQDDAHIFCAPKQLEQEATKLLKHGLSILSDFGFNDYNIYLSTRPKKFAGTKEGWEKSTETLIRVLKGLKLDYKIDQGGGVFYGPKIDIKIKDSLDREWQCTTIQIDFNLPERFNITFINENGKKIKPFMIHRALIGSMERFIGVLIEHYGGAFPFWLAPVQTCIIPIGEKYLQYAHQVAKELKNENIKVKVWDEEETLSNRIRKAEKQKIPYMIVVGGKEEKAKVINVRHHKKGEMGKMTIKEFIKETQK